MNNIELINLAKETKKNAYAPITNFKVGAVVLTKTNQIYRGVNIEEYVIPSMSNCAERNAIASAISNGEREFEKIAIVGGKAENVDETLVCCGSCLQYILDMCPDIKIVCYIDGNIVEKSINDFLNFKHKLVKE